MKKILIVQVRPEDEAADNELEAFLKFGQLSSDAIHRVQADREAMGDIDLSNYAAVIVGGGPLNVSDAQKSEQAMRAERDVFALLDKVVEHDFPFLGACYGFGALVAHQRAVVSKEQYSEDVGAITIVRTRDGDRDPLLKNLPAEFRAFGGHKEACQTLPYSATLLAGSENCPVQMLRIKNNIYATQFHPELDTNGIVLRINVYRHAGYFPPEEADELIATVKKEVVSFPPAILENFVARYRK
jgi:GMP synthase (glutamine-hydrolysing)